MASYDFMRNVRELSELLYHTEPDWYNRGGGSTPAQEKRKQELVLAIGNEFKGLTNFGKKDATQFTKFQYPNVYKYIQDIKNYPGQNPTLMETYMKMKILGIIDW